MARRGEVGRRDDEDGDEGGDNNGRGNDEIANDKLVAEFIEHGV